MTLSTTLLYPFQQEATILASLGSDVISGAAPVPLPTMLQMAKAITEGTALTNLNTEVQLVTSELGEGVVMVPEGSQSQILSGDQYVVSEALNGVVTKVVQLADDLETHKVAVSRTHQANQYDILNSGSDIVGGTW